MAGIFITGTDTGIGKTHVTLSLIKSLQQQGLRVAGMKPVASGAELVNGELRNEDALLIQKTAGAEPPYDLINPYCFAPPVSPHLAARQAGVEIDLQHINECYQQLAAESDMVIVEGVGGWLAPLSHQHTVADLAQQLKLPVVLVVGIRLGCLNHAALTYKEIKQSGLKILGWVANACDAETQNIDAQIEYLSERLGQAPLVKLGHTESPISTDVNNILDLLNSI